MSKKVLFLALALACLLPQVGSATALFGGMFFAAVLGNPMLAQTRKWAPKLLQISVVGLGAGMDLGVIARVGLQGIGYTVAGISFTFLVGTLLGRLLGTPRDTTTLITVGTAICGGSAIAAVAPVIRAKPHEVSVALGVVFALNAVALLVFPPIGHILGMAQAKFGLWSALAIHDTSSVVGASMQYGAEAMQVATAVKLARALWIIPITVIFSWSRSNSLDGPTKKPWFIAGFLLAAAVVTIFPALKPAGHLVDAAAKRVLVVTLFFIGSTLTRDTLRTVGFKPALLGILLWLSVAITSLLAIVIERNSL